MQLRPYQTDLYQSARREFAAGHRRVVMQMATGGGKTPVGCAVIQSAAAKGHEVWMVCHKNFLVEQASDKLKQFGVYHGIVSSTSKYNARQKVHVCSLGVLRNRFRTMRPPALLLWDECHHLGARTWTELMDALPDTYHLGLTATPQRPGGGGLGQHFTSLIVGPSPADLIAWGKQHPGEGLCDYRMFSTLNISADGLHTRAGDFVSEELGELMDRPAIIGDIVAEFKKNAANRKFLTFAPTLAFSEHIAEKYREEGINCVHLDGHMDKKFIKQVVRDLARGDVQGIVSRDILLEGLDVSSVGCVQWTRHTKSRVVKMQGDGRGMRNEVGKENLIILDHVQNWKRFGLPDDPIEWTLDPGKPKSAAEPSTTKECVRCYCRYSIARSSCPECGMSSPVRMREIEQEAGELQEIQKDIARKVLSPAKIEQSRAKSLKELEAIALARGYKPNWAKHVYEARMKKNGNRARA